MCIVGLANKVTPNHNTQHTKHNNQPKWSITVLPPSGFALYCHGNSRHGSNSRCSIFQQVHARLATAYLAVPWSVPLFGAPAHTSWKNRVMGLALALSGRNLNWRHNKQPSVGISSGSDSEEVARGVESVGKQEILCLGPRMEQHKNNEKCIHGDINWPPIGKPTCNNQFGPQI